MILEKIYHNDLPVADSLMNDLPSGFSSLNYKGLYESRMWIYRLVYLAYGNFSFEHMNK